MYSKYGTRHSVKPVSTVPESALLHHWNPLGLSADMGPLDSLLVLSSVWERMIGYPLRTRRIPVGAWDVEENLLAMASASAS